MTSSAVANSMQPG